jgi:hypothetical protein
VEFSRPPNEAPQQCVVAFSHHAVMGVYDADGNVIEMPSWAAVPHSPTCVTFSPTWFLHRVLFPARQVNVTFRIGSSNPVDSLSL